MAKTVDLNQGYFLAFAFEAILWGCHFAIFNLALYVLAKNRKRRLVNKFLSAVMIMLFLLCTTHFSLIFFNVYDGLMRKGYPIGVENNILIGADMLVFTTDFLGQTAMIYRCWLVWGNRWYIVVLPALMSLTSFSLGMSALGLLVHIDPNAAYAPPAVYRNGLAALGIPLGTNFLVTSLIMARIWYLSKRTPNFLPSKSILAATAVVVESGALLVFAQLTACVLFVLNHPAQNIAICSTVQFYGIATTLITIRVGMGSSVQTTVKTNVTTINFVDPTSSQYVAGANHDSSYGGDSGMSTLGVDTKTNKAEVV